MEKKIREIFQSNFIRNVTILIAGTAGAQALTMVFSPLITRLYGPEAFGQMGAFLAIVSIIAPIVALTYPTAIVLAKTDYEVRGIIQLSLRIILIFSITLLLILILFNDQISNILNLNEISSYLYLIPLIILFSGLMEILEQWLIRTKQFSINASVLFFQALILNVSKIGFGLVTPIASVLIIISAFGDSLRVGMTLLFTKKINYKSYSKLNEKVVNKKKNAKKYIDFPIYRAPQILLNGISEGLPILFLTSFFGPVSAGLYTIGRTTLSAPVRLVGKAVGDVFYPHIAEAEREDKNLTIIILKATLSLGLIGIIPFGLVILYGPTLFSFIFGSDWYNAGKYASWMAIWVYFTFMNQPSIRALPVLSAQAFHLKFTLVTVVVRLLALSLGYFVYNDDIIAIAFFSVSGALINILLILLTLKISRELTNKKNS